MTRIPGTYMLFVDRHGHLRLQMHGAPRSVYVGGVTEIEHSGEVIFLQQPV